MPSAIQVYLRDIEKSLARGDATEHTYRPALKTLVESFAQGITATNEPRRVRCGAPDFIVSRNDMPIGYIECKDIGASMDDAAKSEQLQRYFESLEHVILTDYLEFRYYMRGELEMEVILAQPSDRKKLKKLVGAEEYLTQLFTVFFAAQAQMIGTSKELAARMAIVADVIRDAIERAFADEDEVGTLHAEYESFRGTLLSDITPQQFADMYAQTICYGMFSARVNVPDQHADKFTRQHAAYDLPATNPFLKEIFDYIAGTRLDTSIVWAVDLLADILRHCDMSAILKNFGKATRQEDPVVHFYETFLAAYDPKLRETRGVYYTPEPVVSYIVRSVDAILKRDFGCPEGLADWSTVPAQTIDPATHEKIEQQVHRVQILDPATGTGTFLYEVVRHIYDALARTRGSWAGRHGYVDDHLLPRLFGFELMMAPYAVAHLKLGWLLKETGHDVTGGERLHVYLTNTLEAADVSAPPVAVFMNQIAREANAANKVKTQSPIMVVLGNPPYSGHSANKNKWSKDLIKNKLAGPDGAPGYFEYNGRPLGERNPKWLNDDYVKFIRFGQYRIERTGYGILAFITNNGYLDNPTFRGMRQSLMKTFDDIYLVDLHGSTKKRETSPDGAKDENVFDIMQGVSIGIFVRKPQRPKAGKVRHAHLHGTRRAKYKWLASNDVDSTKWKTVKPAEPFHLFCPQDTAAAAEYEACWQITDIMPVNVLGFQTHRDDFAVSFDMATMRQRINDMRNPGIPDDEVAARYGLFGDSPWNLSESRRKLQNDSQWARGLVECAYRPFDTRACYYGDAIMDRPRREIAQHVLGRDNYVLVCSRQQGGLGFRHVWAATQPPNDCLVSNSSREANQVFPLYLYPNGMLVTSPWPAGKDDRHPNLSAEFVRELSEKLGLEFVSDGAGDRKKTFGPEDVFHYAYAVLHCPAYRARYAEFLKIDFPRLPLTADRKRFARLCELGAELAALHLLRQVPAPTADFHHAGSRQIDRVAYKPPTDQSPGRVFVNDEQYFEPVPPEVWEFRVGGYQVCEKWLKDRKGRALGHQDISRYSAVVEAIGQTIRVMREIDQTIPAWPMA